jgi:hypothetical protein
VKLSKGNKVMTIEQTIAKLNELRQHLSIEEILQELHWHNIDLEVLDQIAYGN